MTPPRDPIHQMQIAFQEGDHERALKVFATLPAGVDGYYQALFLKGQIAQARGDQEGALECFREAMRHIKTPRQLYHYADFLLDQGEPAKAEGVLRRLLSLDPTHYDANLRLAVLLRERGALDEAGRCLDRALRADSHSVLARFLMAQLCVQRHEHQRALAQLHLILKLQEGYAPALRLRGEICQKIGDHRQALVEFCQLANRDEHDVELFAMMATSFGAIGDKAQQIKCWEWEFGLDTERTEVGARAARAREKKGETQRAVALYRALLGSEYDGEAREALLRLTGEAPSKKRPAVPDHPLAGELASFAAPAVTIQVKVDPMEQIQKLRGREFSQAPKRRPEPTAPLTPPPRASANQTTGLERVVGEYVDALAKLIPPGRLAEIRRQISTKTLGQIKDQVTDKLRDVFGG